MIIDTHCHYNVEPLYSQIDKHWKNSLKNNVIGGICIGTDIENSKIALKLAQDYPSMFASIAIHPEELTDKIKPLITGDKYSQKEIDEVIENTTQAFDRLLTQTLADPDNKLIGIGEVGLDYFRLKKKGVVRNLVESAQRKVFTHQLVLAFKHNLPLILHVRDQIDRSKINAYYDTYEIVHNLVQKYTQQSKTVPPIILHCASGPIDYIKEFIKLGAYIGFAGNVSYENAKELRQIIEITPKDKVLLETDAPYLAPLDKKGEICEPFFIKKTAEFLQNNYQLDIDIILNNTIKVFPQFEAFVK